MATKTPSYVKDLDELDDIQFERTKQAPINLESVRLLDLVRFREGTAVRLIPVEPKKQNVDLSWKVEYVPDRGMFESLTSYLKLFMGRNITEITTDQFPDKAIDPDFTIDHEEAGVPRRCVLMLENEEEEAPVRDEVIGQIQGSITAAEESEGEAWSQKRAQEAKNLGTEGGKRAATQKESPSRSRRDRDRDRDGKRKSRKKNRGNR